MCTAIHFKNNSSYFGRTLDLEYHYNEMVTITPTKYDFKFTVNPDKHRYAIIGMATVADSYPLYYDAMNEKGLAMAGLNFPDNAVYHKKTNGCYNVASFELIPFILSQCANIEEAVRLLKQISVSNRNFSDKFPSTPLHWLVADRQQSVTVEPLSDGLRLYKNEVGVLTNNPPFEYQLCNLSNYLNLSNHTPSNPFGTPKTLYSKGLGAFGLPGDGSSTSRFVRAVFNKWNSVCENKSLQEINQFFHILGSVEQLRGCTELDDGKYLATVYTSCCDLDSGIYYYTTYENGTISGVDLFRENLNSTKLISYPLLTNQTLNIQNHKRN